MARDEFWDALKAHSQEKFDARRADNLAAAPDDGRWTKHTPFHWSRRVNGDRLDYWPSRARWRIRGKMCGGDVGKLKALIGIKEDNNA